MLLSSAAYVLVEFVRREGLAGTELETAQVGTIRLKLLKIGATWYKAFGGWCRTWREAIRSKSYSGAGWSD